MKTEKKIKKKVRKLREKSGMIGEPRENGEFPNVHDEPHESWEHTKAIEILRWVLKNEKGS